MSIRGPAGPGEAPPAWRIRRRSRILAAATKLFAQRPYLGVQMDDIARAAGAGKATLYRYFSTKADLYLEIFDDALVELNREIAAEVARDRAPERMMAAIVEAIVATFSVHLRTLGTLVGEEIELADRMRRTLRQRRRDINALLSAAFERAIARGTLRGFDPRVAPSLLIGMCWGAVMGNANLAPRAAARAVTDIFINGVSRGGRDGISRSASPEGTAAFADNAFESVPS
jgi:AcrR family transcriptional regulator